MGRFAVEIPEGQAGKWRIERFTVSEEESKIDAMRGMFHGGRYTPPGTYTRLVRVGSLFSDTIMSDTPDELRDLYDLQRHARGGQVLIMGLGLGCAVQMVLQRPEVEKVTVVEKSPDVMSLVVPCLKAHYDGRLEVVEGDAFTWRPPKGVRYSAVWHDIFDNICSDNLPLMTKLKRKYGRRCDWQGCWCEHQCRLNQRRGY